MTKNKPQSWTSYRHWTGKFFFSELEFSKLLNVVSNGILLSIFVKTLAQIDVHMFIHENEVK